jgi:hypothetical protein
MAGVDGPHSYAALRLALDTERQAEQALDRAYREPLRKELEEFQKAESQG